jgi:hypothetical protein
MNVKRKLSITPSIVVINVIKNYIIENGIRRIRKGWVRKDGTIR